MGMFDRVNLFMVCPYCGDLGHIEGQTKDLTNSLFNYTPLDKDWETSSLQKPMRKTLPVFPGHPHDRIAVKGKSIWKNQAELHEAEATIPKEFWNLKYVTMTCDCHSIKCQFDAGRRDILRQGCPSGFGRLFEAKIAVKDGKLWYPVYDIEKDGLTEAKLSRYKLGKNKKYYDNLIRKYKHEMLVVDHWGWGVKDEPKRSPKRPVRK